MKKGIFLFCAVFILALFMYTPVFAEENAEEYYDIFELDKLEEYGDVKGIFMQLFGGDAGGVLNKISLPELFFGEIKNCAGLLKGLLAVAMLNAVAASVNFGTGKNVEYMAFTTSCIMAAGLCLRALEEAMLVLKGFSSFYLGLVGAAAPAAAAALAISGRATLAGGSAAVIFAGSDALAIGLKTLIIPCIGFYAACGIVNCISPKAVLTKLSALIKKIVLLGVRVSGMAFTAILGIERAVTAGVDNIASKTAVTAVKAVPVVGDVFAAGAEGVMAIISNAKSSVAGTLIIILILGCAAPLAKVFAISLSFHVCAALSEPLGDRRISDMIETAGDACGMIFYVMLALAVIFIGAAAILMFGMGA